MPRMVFIEPDGARREVDAPAGRTLLEIARLHGIDIEGACEGSLSCATCHVVVPSDDYARLPPADADERDMLDLAYGLTPTSRLGCQVVVTEDLDGLTVRVPPAFGP